ncbi:MAG: sensor domain-containing diguanylate cyclase [candidate division NC10 bacterium]|nr:sensor domain-containing diguanylate cyclase [candidate division NC10 bacterium]MBI2162781.1 sensor domain-containing diguanylate cyclase [candidate division NC10 bacterium]
MERTAGGEGARPDDSALQQRIRELEAQVQGQAREIRALEKIESLQDGNRELEAENRTLREKVAELHTFLNLSKTLSATLNMEELFRLALHLIGRSLHVDAYSLMLLDEAGERLVVKAAFGLPEDGGPGLTLRLGEGISGLVAQTGQAMLVPDASAESRFLEQECFPQQHGSFICVPLRIKGREVIGVLNAQKPEPHGFSLGDMDLFQAVANQVAAALENAQLYQRTKELSARDDLTGLFNRRHFFENLEKEIQRARRYRRVFSLLMLDLDDFKGYNDSHGHLRGDEALKEVARLLLANSRRADVVGRFGGEEFVVLLPEINKQGAAVVAEKMRAAVEQYAFFGRESQPGGRLTVTLGLVTYPVDSEEGLELVDLADRALYAGKQQGGNRVSDSPAPGGAPLRST